MASILSGITGAATGAVDTLKDKAVETVDKNTQEKMALQGASIPDFIIDFYQTQRRALGYEAQTSSGTLTTIAISIAVVLAIIGIILAMILRILIRQPIVKAAILILFCAAIAYVLYYLYLKPSTKKEFAAEVRDDFNALFGANEGFQVRAAAPDGEQSLINLQPLSVRQIAYVGPEKGGLFDVEAGIYTPLKFGIRFFTFQIDYLDATKDSNSFASPGEPTLLYRDDAMVLVSKNSANLRRIADELGRFAFTEEVLNNTFPLVIYLHFTRTPNATKSPELYLDFLKKTAVALEPLLTNHLGLTGDGSFVRQQAEATLFTTPIKALERKVIFLTNVDTTLFRRPEALGLQRVEPKADLDYLVHARVYAETPADAMGATSVSAGERPAAVLVSLPRVLGLSTKEQEAFAQRGKGRFVIGMGSQLGGNPTAKQLKVVLESLAVNSVLMSMAERDKSDLKRKIDSWKNKFYRAKPLILQSMRQTPVGANML